MARKRGAFAAAPIEVRALARELHAAQMRECTRSLLRGDDDGCEDGDGRAPPRDIVHLRRRPAVKALGAEHSVEDIRDGRSRDQRDCQRGAGRKRSRSEREEPPLDRVGQSTEDARLQVAVDVAERLAGRPAGNVP